MKFEIKSRWSDSVLFSLNADSLKLAVEAAVKSNANLHGADLHGANLRGADLRGADLALVRDDIWAVLSASPAEVEGLRQAIIDGKINGSTYEGECACLVGTLANVRHCKFTEIPSLVPDGNRPAERFFLGIKTGDTPENSEASRLALEWVDQWLKNVRGEFSAEVPK